MKGGVSGSTLGERSGNTFELGEQENKLVGKPVRAANTRQGDVSNAEQSEESWLVSWQQGGLVEDYVDTERGEQQLQG
jgi:hypothetical protein